MRTEVFFLAVRYSAKRKFLRATLHQDDHCLGHNFAVEIKNIWPKLSHFRSQWNLNVHYDCTKIIVGAVVLKCNRRDTDQNELKSYMKLSITNKKCNENVKHRNTFLLVIFNLKSCFYKHRMHSETLLTCRTISPLSSRKRFFFISYSNTKSITSHLLHLQAATRSV